MSKDARGARPFVSRSGVGAGCAQPTGGRGRGRLAKGTEALPASTAADIAQIGLTFLRALEEWAACRTPELQREREAAEAHFRAVCLAAIGERHPTKGE